MTEIFTFSFLKIYMVMDRVDPSLRKITWSKDTIGRCEQRNNEKYHDILTCLQDLQK